MLRCVCPGVLLSTIYSVVQVEMVGLLISGGQVQRVGACALLNIKLLFQKTQENQRGDSEAAPYSASSRKTSSRDSSVPAHAQLSPQVGRGWGPRLPRGRSGEETPAPAVPPPAHARGAQCFLTPQRRPAGAASSALAKTAGVFPPPRGRRNFGCQESNL